MIARATSADNDATVRDGCAIAIKRVMARNSVMETVVGSGWSGGDKIEQRC